MAKQEGGRLDGGGSREPRPAKKLAETILAFDPAKEVPDHVGEAILLEWLIPSFVEVLCSSLSHVQRNANKTQACISVNSETARR